MIGTSTKSSIESLSDLLKRPDPQEQPFVPDRDVE
jgi:hypothetical protein